MRSYFADAAALTAHTEAALQQLITLFAEACTEFGLTISLKKTNIMAQDVDTTPTITIGDHTLEVVDKFTYLGSTIYNNLSLDLELNMRIGVRSTLLYGNEGWTLYKHQERRLNAFRMRNLRRLLGITWQYRVSNADVLAQAGMSSMFTTLSQRRLCWLGHVCRMSDGRIPKGILYGELATGTWPTGRPALRYKDVCKRYLKSCNINPSKQQRSTL